MAVEQMNVVISAATLVVLLTAAIAALVQLRQIRASNDVSTFSEAFELWYSPAVQEGITFSNVSWRRKWRIQSSGAGSKAQALWIGCNWQHARRHDHAGGRSGSEQHVEHVVAFNSDHAEATRTSVVRVV